MTVPIKVVEKAPRESLTEAGIIFESTTGIKARGSVIPATVALLFSRRRGTGGSGGDTAALLADKPALDESIVSDVLPESLRADRASAAPKLNADDGVETAAAPAVSPGTPTGTPSFAEMSRVSGIATAGPGHDAHSEAPPRRQ